MLNQKACKQCDMHKCRLRRGLCNICYKKAQNSVLSGKTTWKQLVAEGKANATSRDDLPSGHLHSTVITVKDGKISKEVMDSVSKVVARKLQLLGYGTY